MNWINWTLLSCTCNRLTATGTCSNSRWGTVSKADDQWIDTKMHWCPVSVGCIIMGINFLGISGLSHGWMWLLWAVDRMWYYVNTAQKGMTVKSYARSMRTHKLTLQALWPILLPRLNDHLDSVHEELRTELPLILTTLHREYCPCNRWGGRWQWWWWWLHTQWGHHRSKDKAW